MYYKLKEKIREQLAKIEDKPIDQVRFDCYTPQFAIRPVTQAYDSKDVLAMKTADPLWMLGRQWQFGEFIGEDNGTPVNVKVHYKKAEVTNCFTTIKVNDKEVEVPVSGKSIKDVPLETMVEAMLPKMDLKMQVRLGQQMERLIRERSANDNEKLIDDLRNEYKLKRLKFQNAAVQTEKEDEENLLDEKSERFYEIMKGKVIGGKELWDAIVKETDTLVPVRIKQRFEKWYRDTFYTDIENSPWKDNKLAHDFHLKSGNGNIKLNAPDYQSGHLDWYSFDEIEMTKAEHGRLEMADNEGPEIYMPINVKFPSMPDKRLFAFEDSGADLGLMEVQADNMFKDMIQQFGLVSGSDWYTIPLDMNLGEMCWIDRIEVTDVFGVTTEISNKYTGNLNQNPLLSWDMFKIRPFDVLENRVGTTQGQGNSLYQPKEHFLLMPPTVMKRLESEPLEELLFVRDEYANMVWALEQKATNGMGQATNGFDLHLEVYGEFVEEATEGDIPVYRLASRVPTNWIPFLPEQKINGKKDIKLVKATMPGRSTDVEEDIEALTQLLDGENIEIWEEAIPKAGVRIQLTRQRVRWSNGKTFVWTGRKVLSDRGEGNSGLQFDYLK